MRPDAEVLAEELIKSGASPDDVLDILIDKGYVKIERSAIVLEWLDSLAVLITEQGGYSG